MIAGYVSLSFRNDDDDDDGGDATVNGCARQDRGPTIGAKKGGVAEPRPGTGTGEGKGKVRRGRRVI